VKVWVKIRTQLKKKIHRDLSSSNIKHSSVVTDIFGKSGMHILRGLLDGQPIDEIIKTMHSGRVKKNADKIRSWVKVTENHLENRMHGIHFGKKYNFTAC